MAAAGSPVETSTVRSAFGIVEIGFIAARTRRASPVDIPPSGPPDLPDVPTIAEAGVPGYEATLWLGLAAPAGVPAEIVQRLNTDISNLLRDPDVQQGFRAAGVDASVLGPAEFGAFLRTEFEKWGKVVRDTGATVN